MLIRSNGQSCEVHGTTRRERSQGQPQPFLGPVPPFPSGRWEKGSAIRSTPSWRRGSGAPCSPFASMCDGKPSQTSGGEVGEFDGRRVEVPLPALAGSGVAVEGPVASRFALPGSPSQAGVRLLERDARPEFRRAVRQGAATLGAAVGGRAEVVATVTARGTADGSAGMGSRASGSKARGTRRPTGPRRPTSGRCRPRAPAVRRRRRRQGTTAMPPATPSADGPSSPSPGRTSGRRRGSSGRETS